MKQVKRERKEVEILFPDDPEFGSKCRQGGVGFGMEPNEHLTKLDVLEVVNNRTQKAKGSE